MTAKQKAKHITDNIAKTLTPEGSSLDAAEPTADGLGAWEGGTVKGANNWVSLKSRAQRTGDTKNTPGIEYASKIEAWHQKGYYDAASIKVLEGMAPTEPRPEAFCPDCEFESSVASSHEHEGFFEDADES